MPLYTSPDLFLPLLLGSPHSLTFYPPPLCHRCLLHFFWSHFPVPPLFFCFHLCFFLHCLLSILATQPLLLSSISPARRSQFLYVPFYGFHYFTTHSVLVHPYWHGHTVYLRTLRCVHVGGSNKQSALSRKLWGNTLWNYNRRSSSKCKWGGIWKGEAAKTADLRQRSQSAYRGQPSK